MSVCILIAGTKIVLATLSFTLSWTHSVEKVEWREAWRSSRQGFVLEEARVKGSGAGMEPGEGAALKDGWWVWRPILPPQERLTLAASGKTPSAWHLCSGPVCHDLGASSGEPVIIETCFPAGGQGR